MDSLPLDSRAPVSGAVNPLLRAARLLAAPATGEDDFYAVAAKALAIGLGSRAAGVSLISPDGGAIAVSALWDRDEPGPSFSFPIAGTPCAEVVANAVQGARFRFDARLSDFPGFDLSSGDPDEVYCGEAFFDAHGRPAGLVFSIGDESVDGPDLRTLFSLVRDRVESEYRRARAEEHYDDFRRIVSLSTDYVAIVDLSYGYQAINPAYLAAFGWEGGQTLPRSISELHGSRSFESLLRPILDRCFNGEIVRTESWFDVPAHRRQFLDVSAVPSRDGDREITGAILCIRDLTARKVALQERRGVEARVEQARRIESLGVLAGGIAHDFNNLLVGMLGGADLLLTETLSDEGQRTARTIKQSALLASDLCRRLLSCAGQAPFDPESTELSQLVRQAVSSFAGALPEQVTVELDLSLDLSPIELDPSEVSHAIVSLITNAAESYEGRPGTVHIASGTAEIDRSFLDRIQAPDQIEPGQFVFVQVRDHGIGVDLDTRARIFDPFFSTKPSGRGIGLAATQGIVHTHGGCIQFDSLPGNGTTVRVFFPMPADSSAVAAPREPVEAGSQGRILIVDDEEMMLDITSKMLGRANFETLSASSAAEAATIFSARSHDIDMILLDATLPGSACHDVVDRLLRLDPTARIVLCSGYSSSDPGLIQTLPKCYGFLPKPFSSEVLIQKIEDTISHRTN